MIKIALWIEGIKKFRTKEEALEALRTYYAGLKLDDGWADDLDKARKEVEAGSTRVVLDGRMDVGYHVEGNEVKIDYMKPLELPDDFFDENHSVIKALIFGEIYEFKTKEEAVEGLKGLLPEMIEFDKTLDKYSPNREVQRFLVNVELIKKGATRVVDANSEIPEGFYD